MRKVTRLIAVAAVLLAGALGGVMSACADDSAGDNLPAIKILRICQARYASLTNYSDGGEATSRLGDAPVAPCRYAIKMGRPHLYRIAWEQNSDVVNQKGAVWSTGDGDFLKMGDTVQKKADLGEAFATASGISGGATASIPGAFFDVGWSNPLGGTGVTEQRLADARLGAVDCFVLMRDLKGTTRTLWIGKKDFLIHQVQRVTSAAEVKARIAEAIKRDPKLAASLSASSAQAITSTETHTNIVVNQKFAPADFGN